MPEMSKFIFCPCPLLSRLSAFYLCQKMHRFLLVKINFILTQVTVDFKQKMPKKDFFAILEFKYGNLSGLW